MAANTVEKSNYSYMQVVWPLPIPYFVKVTMNLNFSFLMMSTALEMSLMSLIVLILFVLTVDFQIEKRQESFVEVATLSNSYTDSAS